MTMDIHLQITLPNECVTPNVPRIKASFFNRKYRDIQSSTPSTPKVTNARVRVSSSTSTRSRSKRSGSSGVGTGSSGRQQTYSPYSGRPSRSRPSNSEFFDPDFSTPRATKSLLTPTTNGTRLGKNGRITHLIYKPLELDNESSSESIDTRRKRSKLLVSQEDRSPLAIEAPAPKSLKDELETIVDDSATVMALEDVEQTKADENEDTDIDEPEIIEVRPEIIEVKPDFPTFVPGNCNIEEVLKLFGKEGGGSAKQEIS